MNRIRKYPIAAFFLIGILLTSGLQMTGCLKKRSSFPNVGGVSPLDTEISDPGVIGTTPSQETILSVGVSTPEIFFGAKGVSTTEERGEPPLPKEPLLQKGLQFLKWVQARKLSLRLSNFYEHCHKYKFPRTPEDSLFFKFSMTGANRAFPASLCKTDASKAVQWRKALLHPGYILFSPRGVWDQTTIVSYYSGMFYLRKFSDRAVERNDHDGKVPFFEGSFYQPSMAHFDLKEEDMGFVLDRQSPLWSYLNDDGYKESRPKGKQPVRPKIFEELRTYFSKPKRVKKFCTGQVIPYLQDWKQYSKIVSGLYHKVTGFCFANETCSETMNQLNLWSGSFENLNETMTKLVELSEGSVLSQEALDFLVDNSLRHLLPDWSTSMGLYDDLGNTVHYYRNVKKGTDTGLLSWKGQEYQVEYPPRSDEILTAIPLDEGIVIFKTNWVDSDQLISDLDLLKSQPKKYAAYREIVEKKLSYHQKSSIFRNSSFLYRRRLEGGQPLVDAYVQCFRDIKKKVFKN